MHRNHGWHVASNSEITRDVCALRMHDIGPEPLHEIMQLVSLAAIEGTQAHPPEWQVRDRPAKPFDGARVNVSFGDSHAD
jgi:hypothetical protein